ncbi:MAG TPA: hypothetical protein VGB55_11950 [Tepidisphaeraceae bacterium]
MKGAPEGGEMDKRSLRRKVVAVLALIGCGVVLWLERGPILSISLEGIFWLLIGGVTIVLAACELLGVDAKASQSPEIASHNELGDET